MRDDFYKDLQDQLLAQIDPVRIREHLRSAGWIHEARLDDTRIAVYERPESRLEQIIVPLVPTSQGFVRCMTDAVFYLAQWEQRQPRDILTALLLPPADVISFQEAGQAALTGLAAPLDRGLSLTLGARKLVLAAACAVARPGQMFYPRSNIPEAVQLVHRCRLVQPGVAGFAVTLAVPLAAVPSSEPLFETETSPFARRVTELLVRSLWRLTQALKAGELDRLLTPAEGEPVVSANLCEGLVDLAPQGEAGSLTIDVRWDHTHPTTLAAGPVRLRREDFPRIEALAQRLRPAPESARQALLGLVETLNGRMNADQRIEGEVWLTLLDPQGETVRVRADLNAEDYAAAANAHLRGLPVSLQGVLRRAGRTASIEDVTEFQVYPRLVPHQESA